MTLPTLRGRVFAVAALVIAGGAFACALDAGGLEVSPTSHPVGASLGDATVTAPGASADGAAEASAPPSPGEPVGASEDASTSAPVPDAATPSPPVVDANAPDVVSGDGGHLTGGPSDPCDLDQDGFRSETAECGGTDCCDTDGRAFPGQASFFTAPDTCGSFDYDCNGANDLEFDKASCTLGVLTCNGSGFDQAAPACGVAATFNTCHLGIGCFTTQAPAVQGCR